MSRGPNQIGVTAVVKQQYDTGNVWSFENQWRTELFSCNPFSRFCFAWCCPCCMNCKLAKHLGESSAIGCCPGSLSYLRTKLRTARRVQGSYCGDCCSAHCCGPCVANQMATELESQGLWDVPRITRKTYPRNDRYPQQNNGDY